MRKITSYFIYYILGLLAVPSVVFADFEGGCCAGSGYVSSGHMSEVGHRWTNSMLGYGWIFFIIIWVLLILLISFLFFYLSRSGKSTKEGSANNIIDRGNEFIEKDKSKDNKDLKVILKGRLVRGEISQKDYEKIKLEIEK